MICNDDLCITFQIENLGCYRTSSRSTDQVPNVRHIRVLHTFSSMTSLVLLIQQDVEEVYEFCQHDGMVTVMVK